MAERLLDSVILIDHLNDLEPATRFLTGLKHAETAISVITRAEILTGIEENQKTMVKAMLDQYRLLGINKPIADLAADLRKENGWKLPDAFQAALAIHHHLILVTRDTKDFHQSEHSFVEIPYRLSFVNRGT